MGEVIRRVTGKTLATFFAERSPVAGRRLPHRRRAGVRCAHRAADPVVADDRAERGLARRPRVLQSAGEPQVSGTIPWASCRARREQWPRQRALSVALVQTVLACGGEVRGVRLLSSAAACGRWIRNRTAPTSYSGCPFASAWATRSAARRSSRNSGARIDGHRIAFWGGSGGSWVINDLDEHLTVAFVMNKHVESGGWDHPRHGRRPCGLHDRLALVQEPAAWPRAESVAAPPAPGQPRWIGSFATHLQPAEPVRTRTEERPAMAEIHGTCNGRSRGVRAVLESHLDSGADIGASLAVFVERPTREVDLWGGYWDATFSRPSAHDTLVQVFSSTKTFTALCALVLADRGGDRPSRSGWRSTGPSSRPRGKGRSRCASSSDTPRAFRLGRMTLAVISTTWSSRPQPSLVSAVLRSRAAPAATTASIGATWSAK